VNVTGGKRSAYFLRHGVEFHGKYVPFGCLIDYLPTSHLAGNVPAFAPTAIPGIFLGHHFYSGGVWGHSHKQGDYFIADFSHMQNAELRRKPHRYRVTSIIFTPASISFPMKEDFVRRTRTLQVTDKDVTYVAGHDFDRGTTSQNSTGQSVEKLSIVDAHVDIYNKR
jgi:hypothetical protein